MNKEEIYMKYPWIKENGHKLIISPDSDGLLSALLFVNYFDAEVVGYYDGKVMIVKDGVNPPDCVFLDMDVYHEKFRSVGHHMVLYNKNHYPSNWENYRNCIQLNNLRNFDRSQNFQQKYPFATIHFLLELLGGERDIELGDDAIVPLLFSDGVWTVLFGYTENCLDWFNWMDIRNPESILYPIFCGSKSFLEIMEEINTFLRKRDTLNSIGVFDFNSQEFIPRATRRSGDKLIISNGSGHPTNLVKKEGDKYDLHSHEVDRVKRFINLLSETMGWSPFVEKWCFEDFKLYNFEKGIIDGKSRTLSIISYKEVAEDRCFSMAITSSLTLEYTKNIKNYFNEDVAIDPTKLFL
jgi:hypothetical protein